MGFATLIKSSLWWDRLDFRSSLLLDSMLCLQVSLMLLEFLVDGCLKAAHLARQYVLDGALRLVNLAYFLPVDVIELRTISPRCGLCHGLHGTIANGALHAGLHALHVLGIRVHGILACL